MNRIQLSNHFLAQAAEELRQGHTVQLRIDGDSMRPFIHGGNDLVVVAPYSGQPLPLFCALFYQWEGHYMIHRLVGRERATNGSEMLCLMGDGNLVRIERIPPSRVIGVLQQIRRPDGTVVSTDSAAWRRKGRLWYYLLGVRKIVARAKSAASSLGRQRR